MVKKSKGRQKIEMVKMKNESNLQVTFSKRRSGLFKKASELCTLCGAEIAMIVFSPGRKVFSFGHPNVESVIDRFLNNNPPPPHQHNNLQLAEADRNSVVRELNGHLTEVLNQLEIEKKKNEELKLMREQARRPEHWWEDAVDGLDFGKLNAFQAKLDSLKEAVTLEASKYFQGNVPHLQNFYGGGSGNAAFGIGAGASSSNHDLDLFSQRRMVNLNAFTNQNMMLPNHALQLGNGNVTEGFVPEYNGNNNQNQSQNLSFKTENVSEYEHYHHGHPPHPGSGHY